MRCERASGCSFNGAAGLTWDTAQQGNASQYLINLRAVEWNASLWAQRYPRLASLHDWWPTGGVPSCAADPNCGPAPAGNVMARNVFINVSTLMQFPPPSSDFPPAAFNITSNLVNVDPLFVSPDPRGDLNFTLTPESPAWGVGFTPIPQECMGRWRRCPGERWGGGGNWV